MNALLKAIVLIVAIFALAELAILFYHAGNVLQDLAVEIQNLGRAIDALSNTN